MGLRPEAGTAKGRCMANGKSIRVTFVDAASGTPFGVSDVPARTIPDSFEADTTLNLAGQDWAVAAAEPMTRAEYERTGALRLSLSKITVQSVPPGDILFSLP